MAANQRVLGYGIGLFVTLVAAVIPGLNRLQGATANLRDFAITVLMGEGLAGRVPRVAVPGDSLKMTVRMEYSESASPWLRRSFTVVTTTEWYDDEGKLSGNSTGSQQRYLADEFPFDLAWQLVNRPPVKLNVNY